MDRTQVADNEYPLRGLSRPFWHSANGLPAYANNQICSEPDGTSQRCQQALVWK